LASATATQGATEVRLATLHREAEGRLQHAEATRQDEAEAHRQEARQLAQELETAVHLGHEQGLARAAGGLQATHQAQVKQLQREHGEAIRHLQGEQELYNLQRLADLEAQRQLLKDEAVEATKEAQILQAQIPGLQREAQRLRGELDAAHEVLSGMFRNVPVSKNSTHGEAEARAGTAHQQEVEMPCRNVPVSKNSPRRGRWSNGGTR
jgi:hypothetical protein